MTLDAVPPGLLAIAAGLAVLLALVQTLRLAVLRAAPRRRIAAARAAGAAGERRAEPLLEGLGYTVLARQAPARYALLLDGEPAEVGLRADLLVERDGRRFVAEVKTGRHAPRIESATTRRQLLEYHLAFEVDGVLLVDVDAGRVRSLEFPSPEARRPEPGVGWLVWLALGGALGFAAAEAPRLARLRTSAHAPR